MQSSSTARFTPTPIAVIAVLAIALAGGFVALYATENLSGQGGSSSLAVLPPAMPPPPDEGSLRPGHNEASVGPGATFDSHRSTINGTPTYGQGEIDHQAMIIRDTGGPWVNPNDGSTTENVTVNAHPPGAFDY